MKKIAIIIFLSTVLIVCALYYSDFSTYITLENLKIYKDQLAQFVNQHYLQAVLIYICTYYASVILVFPIAAVTNIAGGYLFGTVIGTLYTTAAGTIGAITLFLVIRYLFGDMVQQRYPKQITYIKQELKKNTVSFLLFLRLVALFPFFLINMLLGLVPISLWTFTWTTALGTLPSFIIYAYAGQQLATLKSTQDIFSPPIIVMLVLLGCLTLVPIVMRKFIFNKNRKKM